MPSAVKRPEAEDDLEEIFVFLGRRNRAAAERFILAADAACRLLAEMPELGSRCESNHPALRDLRLWSIKGFRKYLLIYRPTTEGVEILRVTEGSRHLPRLFGLEDF